MDVLFGLHGVALHPGGRLIDPNLQAQVTCVICMQVVCAHVPMLLQVLEVRWWMGHYKSKTPKRHKAWTNNAACTRLDMGTFNMKRFRQRHGLSGAVRKNIVKEGRRGYVGAKQLKATQQLPQLLPFHKMHSSSIHVCLCYDALCWFVC